MRCGSAMFVLVDVRIRTHWCFQGNEWKWKAIEASRAILSSIPFSSTEAALNCTCGTHFRHAACSSTRPTSARQTRLEVSIFFQNLNWFYWKKLLKIIIKIFKTKPKKFWVNSKFGQKVKQYPNFTTNKLY